MQKHSKYFIGLLAFAISASITLAPSAFAQNAAPQSSAPQSAASELQSGVPTLAPGSQPRQFHQWRARRGHFRTERWRRHGGRQFLLARMVSHLAFRERLGITSEQAQKIQTETLKFREGQIRNRADTQVKRLELHALLSSQTPDRNAITQKLQQISATRLSQAEASIGYRLDMRAALTPEQQQKLREMRAGFRHHGVHRPGPNG